MVIEISPMLEHELHKIRQRMELPNNLEVLKRSMALYAYLTEEVTKGNKVILVNESGTPLKEVTIE